MSTCVCDVMRQANQSAAQVAADAATEQDKTEVLQQDSRPGLAPTAAADHSANLFEVQLVVWTIVDQCRQFIQHSKAPSCRADLLPW